MTTDDTRTAAYLALAERAASNGLTAFDDDTLLQLLAKHRWALGRLASPNTPPDLRARLQLATLRAHGALHSQPRHHLPNLGTSLRWAWRGLALSAAVFVASGLVTFAAVAADPLLAYSLVDRNLLAEIDASYWGDRSGSAADVGMTFYYWGHNLQVSFLALGLGVLGGFPALLIVAMNGALLGAIAAAAIERGAGMRLLEWIAPHGVPELTGCALCGAIGWELGRSWLLPGPQRRRAALAEAGRRSTPLVLAAALLIIAAAPLEGFIAPMANPRWADTCIAVCWVCLLTASAARALGQRRASAQ